MECPGCGLLVPFWSDEKAGNGCVGTERLEEYGGGEDWEAVEDGMVNVCNSL